MNFTWAVRIFDTFWFLEQRQEDHLVDPDFIRWVSHKLTQGEAASVVDQEALVSDTPGAPAPDTSGVPAAETSGDFALDDQQALALGERLRAFLEALRPMLMSIATDTFDEQAALALLKPLIEGSRGRRRLVTAQPGNGTGLVFEPEQHNGDYVMSELAVTWYILLFDRDRSRLHFCEAPKCGCLFVDTSKNHTKRHCSERCSNRMKAQRHRSKQ